MQKDNYIKDIQMKILNIYLEFKRICEKHNLKYYGIGGTCLGAIRHKGFIPWDDDMDVAMPIEDYNKFRKVASQELSENYKLFDYIDNSNYILNFVKLQDINTTFIEEKNKDCVERYGGVFLDIMPIIGLPKNKIKRNMLMLKLRCLYRLDKVKKTSFNEAKTFKAKILWLISKPFCCKKDINYFALKWEKLFEKYEISSKNDLLFAWRIPLTKRNALNNIYPYEYFKYEKEVAFENTAVYVPAEYDKYLTGEYGDYMKLPPKEKQVSSHTFFVDLNKSYKYYQSEEGRKEINDRKSKENI